MVAELAQWPEKIKLKQLALRLRGPAQEYFRMCSEEQKHDYQALVQARFTPVRIQALECSTFHESKQGRKECIDTYAQELQRLFQRAYPNAVHGNTDAQEMGQAVLSSQFVGGLIPEIKRKIAYFEGMSFSELWQKARFKEARLQDLESSIYASPISRKFPGPTDERHREDRMTPPFRPNQIPNRESTRQFRPGERNQTILCYKCHQPGHVARNCRQGTRFSEAPGRQNVPRTAAVTPNQETIQQREQQSSDTPDESLAWMYGVRHIGQDVTESTCQSLRLGPRPKQTMIVNGIEVEALVDTGCPATIISKTLCRQILDGGVEQDDPSIHEHRRQRATVLQLNKPSLQLHAYCGTQLSIGAEITVDFKVGECQAKGVVLVQENTPVDVLLGTNLMSLLGVQVLDNNGQSLLALQSYEAQEKPVTTEKGLPLNDTVEQQSDYTQQSPFYLLYGRDARLPTEAALAKPRTCYQVDIDDFKTDLVCNLSDAWKLARQNIGQSQKKQKTQYDRKTRLRKHCVGDRVFVHMPGEVQGKAWKFSRPFHGPYRILELTPTNASVRLVDRPQDQPIFVSLDRIRRCPTELSEGETWSGKTGRRRNRRKTTYKHHIPALPPDLPVGENPPGHSSSPEHGSWSTRLRPRPRTRTSMIGQREM